MSYEYYVLYDPERDIELEIRNHERWGWEFNWKNPGGDDRWVETVEKYEDKHFPIADPSPEALAEFREDQERLL